MQDLLRALGSQVANKSNAIRKNRLPWQVFRISDTDDRASSKENASQLWKVKHQKDQEATCEDQATISDGQKQRRMDNKLCMEKGIEE